MGYNKPHQLKDAAGAPVYGGTVPARIFAQTFSDLRALQSPTAGVTTTPSTGVPGTTTSP
jgi:hypothetical protein